MKLALILLSILGSKSFSQDVNVIIAIDKDDHILVVEEPLLNGALYYRLKDGDVFISNRDNCRKLHDGLRGTDGFSCLENNPIQVLQARWIYSSIGRDRHFEVEIEFNRTESKKIVAGFNIDISRLGEIPIEDQRLFKQSLKTIASYQIELNTL